MKNKFMQVSATVGRTGLVCLLVCLLVGPAAFAQKKHKSTSTKPRTSAPTPTPTPPPVNLSTEAGYVAEQLKIVTRFVYVYGKIANGLELAEEQSRRGELSPAAEAKNRQTKEAVATNISGVRTGLETLSKRFQANARLQVQYLKLSYAAESAANAERLVAGGRFDEAGKSLVQAVERLTDVLIALR
ncbi:MAG: hypothetical protein HYR56_25065 [Acidobacteria bacterium]|nr:hypothetical protein [Acidobacteriota bacterium]MBI3421845.1 hypothetical protein [Acidobacteriota bacterium]